MNKIKIKRWTKIPTSKHMQIFYKEVHGCTTGKRYWTAVTGLPSSTATQQDDITVCSSGASNRMDPKQTENAVQIQRKSSR
uniref:Uncharacterized protein n=1 Tax=Anguilla anguilla TaxID=7936 RepID=A0A0E9X7B9_ANGAN